MFEDPLQPLSDAFGQAQQMLFETMVQPLLFGLGFGNLLELAFGATGWLLVGLIQLAIMLLVLRPLERWRPVEATTDLAAVRVDVLYTLIHRLGLFRLALFFTIGPLWDTLFGQFRIWGLPAWHLDGAVASWWPGITDSALFAFVAYLVVLDFVGYWLHRLQHQLQWWWSLHALHHSQRQMTMWTDDRNHLLDTLIMDCFMVIIARLIGIPPGQFVAMVALTQLLESLSHANLKVWFGPWLERVLVSPRFHRLHHSVGLGHESEGRGTLGGRNFAVLFPIWDILFGTANFQYRFDPTGIRDQRPQDGGRDYGRGFWSQQWLGLKRVLWR